MNANILSLEDRLNCTFERVFQRTFDGRQLTAGEVEEWDSLTHIQLVMELERTFGVHIEPDDILGLYKDSSAILAFLRENGVRD